MENGKTEMKMITLYGVMMPDGKTFVVKKRPILDDEKEIKKFSLKKTFLSGKTIVGNFINAVEQKIGMKIVNAKEPGNVVLFCDDEGRIYFYTKDMTKCFMSEDGDMAVTEEGDYYRLERTSDGGYDMFLIEPLVEAFPYRFLRPQKETFDDAFMDEDNDLDLFPDPFKVNEKKDSKVIDFETAKFMNERKGR